MHLNGKAVGFEWRLKFYKYAPIMLVVNYIMNYSIPWKIRIFDKQFMFSHTRVIYAKKVYPPTLFLPRVIRYERLFFT